MLNLAARLRRRIFRTMGIDVAPGAVEWRMEAALERAAERHQIRGVIDVGASNGSWSLMARRHWPAASFLLIEALDEHEEALRALGMTYVMAAAGDQVGTINFNAPDIFGGAASYGPIGADDFTVPMTTVDHEVGQVALPSPYLLKLDTHGFEREILAGAIQTLEQASLLVIEVYNFELRPGALRFHQLCGLLEQRGFRCLDLADPMHRESDGALWQFDLVFGRADDSSFGRTGFT